MEPRTRNLSIVVVVVVIAGCCGVAALAGGAAAWAASRSSEWGPVVLSGPYREQSQRTFQAAGEPGLDITNFAGSVSIRTGEAGIIQVSATKQANTRNQVSRIEVSMTEQGDLLVIRTRKLSDMSNGAVHLEITAPANTRIELRTGAGTVDVRGISAAMNIYSGAGQIDVRDAAGPVRLGLGAGEIQYQGKPSGLCSFDTGVGEIRISLPSEPDVEVDLSTGIGFVDVGFDVDGRVRPREVQGTIGSGDGASIVAHTGAGAITMGR